MSHYNLLEPFRCYRVSVYVLEDKSIFYQRHVKLKNLQQTNETVILEKQKYSYLKNKAVVKSY